MWDLKRIRTMTYYVSPMMRRFYQGWRPCETGFLWFALLASIGCSWHLEGATDLVGDGFSYVEFPGRRVFGAPITLTGVETKRDGSLVALAITSAGDLLIGDLKGTSQCNAGPASTFKSSSAYGQSSSNLPGWVAYLQDADTDGWGTLAFVTHDCTQHVEAARNAKLIGWYTSFEPPRFLAQSQFESSESPGRSSLLLCDPSVPETPCHTLAMIEEFKSGGTYTWTREIFDGGRRLVARNQLLEIVYRDGTDVSEFVLGSGGYWAAYIQQGMLRVGAPGPPLSKIAGVDDACELRLAPSRSRPRSGFTYRTPCADGPLRLADAQSGSVYQLALGATAPVIWEQMQGEAPLFFYVTNPTSLPTMPDVTRPGLTESFFSSYWESAPNSIGTLTVTSTATGRTRAGPVGAWLGSFSWDYGKRVRVLSEFDGNSGTLVEWDLSDGSVTELARGVSDYSWGWAITNAPDGTKHFVGLRQNQLSTTVLTNVRDRGRVYNEFCVLGSIDCMSAELEDRPVERHAMHSDSNANGGRLWLLTRQDTNADFAKPEFLDDAVYDRRYGFLRRGDAVLYLRNFQESDGTGTLTARFVDTLDAFTVDHVSSWGELTGDVPGILYSTRAGTRSGLWFAPLY